MTDLNKIFGMTRVVILSVVCLFSALVLIMGALVIDFGTTLLYFNYSGLAIAISIITILTVPPMIFLSIHRKGAFPSMIIVELGFFCLLWILWLAVAGTVVNVPVLSYCTELSYHPSLARLEAMCRETQAMAAFSFLNWLMLMGLDIFLLTLAIIQATRGNTAIWTSCVTDVNYSAPAAPSAITDKAAYGTAPGTPAPMYPQTAQQAYPPQVYTPQQPYNPHQVYTPQPQQPATPMAAQV